MLDAFMYEIEVVVAVINLISPRARSKGNFPRSYHPVGRGQLHHQKILISNVPSENDKIGTA
jgi:hypothetical protein